MSEILIMIAAEIGDGSTYRITRRRNGAPDLAVGLPAPTHSDIYTLETGGFVGRKTGESRGRVVAQWVGGIPMDEIERHLGTGRVADILGAQCARIFQGRVDHIPAVSLTNQWAARPVEA
jgi:hypothetical protein